MAHSYEEYSVMKEIEKDLAEEYSKNLKIIECLNQLEEIIDKEYCSPIKITQNNKFAVYGIIINKIDYIKDSLLEENKKSLLSICLKIFEILFLNPNSLNYSDLDEKVKVFQLILKNLKDESLSDDNEKYVKEVIRQKKEWKKLIYMAYFQFSDLGIILAPVLKFSKTIQKIIEILLDILKIKHENDFEIKFDLKDLKDADEAKIAQNFYYLFNHETEFFYLSYENGEIIKRYLDPIKTANKINLESMSETGVQQKVNEKEKQVGNIIKNKGKIESESKYEKKILKNLKNGKESIENLNWGTKQKQLLSEIKIEKYEMKTNEKNDIIIRLNKLETYIKNQKKVIERQNKKFEQQKENIESQENEIEQIERQKNELEQQLKSESNEIEKLKNQIKKINEFNISSEKKMEKEIYLIKEQLRKIQTDLDLIKSRAWRQVFI